jgi:hypothetical protein
MICLLLIHSGKFWATYDSLGAEEQERILRACGLPDRAVRAGNPSPALGSVGERLGR